jgi:glucosamine kinase
MILVADSGSTKCDWILIDSQNKHYETNSMGFNPFFHSSDLVYTKLMENELFQMKRKEVNAVYFYGAGCSSADRNLIIQKGLERVFENADLILVDHDLKGAALATSQGEAGITCIIGTGSNSCYFDGLEVHEEVPALGYILGDEASGSYFGRIMLSEWLYHRMPQELASDFEKEYQLTKEGIFEATYNLPDPNVYLARFMPFISKHAEHPYFSQMLFNGLERFAIIHVLCYPNYKEVPVNFVGSVAYYFKEILGEVARKHSFTVGKIEKRPVESLAAYHINNHKQLNES